MTLKSRSFHLMGTVIDLAITYAESELIFDQVEQLLYLYQNRFSSHDLTSSLTEVNLNAGVQPVTVEQDVYDVIVLGKQHSSEENSNLNIALGPLVAAWRIAVKDDRLPHQEELAQLLPLTQPDHIDVYPDTREVYLKKEGMSLDLGALVKGYIADRMVEHLERVGVPAGFINLGGHIRTFGQHPASSNGSWRIGIQDPRLPGGQHLAVLTVEEAAIVTSGVYQGQLGIDGHPYHPILDRKTGYPLASPVASLTIVSDQAIDGEIWTTRLFGMEIEEILEQVEELDGLEAVLVSHQGDIRVSSGLCNHLSLTIDDVDTYSIPAGQASLDPLVVDTRSGASLL